MPKKMAQLMVCDKKILAYDDQSRRFFIVKLEPVDLETLEKSEVIAAVELALGRTEPDAVI